MALEAMTKAWTHEPAESLGALEALEGVLGDAAPGAAPEWFDYYDRPRLAGFKGQGMNFRHWDLQLPPTAGRLQRPGPHPPGPAGSCPRRA